MPGLRRLAVSLLLLGFGACGGGDDQGGATGGSGGNVGGAAGGGGGASGAGSGGTPGNFVCTNCSAMRPACDTSTGRCVGCTSDKDCAGVGVCNLEQHTCFSCRTDADCKDPDYPACNAVAGICSRRCPSCAPYEKCHAASNTCVDCLADSDCGGSSPFCDPKAFRCVYCQSNADCKDSAAPVCGFKDGSMDSTLFCTECADDADCAGGQKCDPGGSCVECATNAHCPSGKVCAPAGECVTPCKVDGDCPGVTIGGVAFETKCDAKTGLCRNCVTDADCAAYEKPFCAPAIGDCVDCRTDSDCPASTPSCGWLGRCGT